MSDYDGPPPVDYAEWGDEELLDERRSLTGMIAEESEMLKIMRPDLAGYHDQSLYIEGLRQGLGNVEDELAQRELLILMVN